MPIMDKVTSTKRSEVMASVKSKGTKLEHFFAERLEEMGLDYYRRNVKELSGTPDFVFEYAKITIFIDSCFWHGCKQHLRMPASNQDYWFSKIKRNRKKDRRVTRLLKNDGWVVLRIWEHSLKNPKTLQWWLTRIKNLVEEKREI